MSGETEPKHYMYSGESESSCGSMSHLHRMGGPSEWSDSSRDPPTSMRSQTQMHEDMEMRGSGTESHSNESRSNESHGNESVGSSRGNGKDSAIMTSSGSNKSSEQSAKAKTQKGLFKTLKELKYHLPPEKRCKGPANTLHTLRYALRCVKEVKANEEYYQMLMINDSQDKSGRVLVYY